PEILAAGFQPFCVHEWLNVPSRGVGEHPLQPLPKHWVHWANAARDNLVATSIAVCSYRNSAEMAASLRNN
ncbi:hypothetical protein ACFL2H_13460, partial [Planctomycetota bacterium]